MTRLASLVCVLVALGASASFAQCGVERWPVKIGTDSDAGFVRRAVITPATIDSLTSLTAPRPLPQMNRVFPTETTVYSVTATLTAFVEEDDSDYHLILSDDAERTMIAEIPAVHCFQGSAFSKEMTAARATFDAHLLAGSTFQHVSIPVEITGVGFFDFLHGQDGVAANGIELHPVLSIDFNPIVTIPPPPMHPGRRRAAWPGIGIPGAKPPTCAVPTLTITLSRPTVCPGEPVTVSWQSSDSTASVSIVGIESPLPASGTATVGATFSTIYSGRATNACGASPEAMALLSVTAGATGSITTPSSIIQAGASTTINVSVANSTGWTLTSALGNGLSARSGPNGSFGIVYTGTHSGSDTLTLTASGACGQIIRTAAIAVNATTGSGFLQCCDGTLSPSCTNCAQKTGCCSSHGGVCGCPP